MEDVKTYFEKDNFAKMIGAELVEVSHGYAKARLLVTEKHLNAAGLCQGGVLFTLADFAFAVAVNSHGQQTLSSSAHVCFLNPGKVGYIYAEAREILDHKRMPYAEVRVTDEEGTLLTMFTAMGYRKNVIL